jgi:hypothetical protein
MRTPAAASPASAVADAAGLSKRMYLTKSSIWAPGKGKAGIFSLPFRMMSAISLSVMVRNLAEFTSVGARSVP